MGTARGQRMWRLNDAERRMWVENDEGLYNWWKCTRVGLYRFVRENRATLDSLIFARLGAQ